MTGQMTDQAEPDKVGTSGSKLLVLIFSIHLPDPSQVSGAPYCRISIDKRWWQDVSLIDQSHRILLQALVLQACGRLPADRSRS